MQFTHYAQIYKIIQDLSPTHPFLKPFPYRFSTLFPNRFSNLLPSRFSNRFPNRFSNLLSYRLLSHFSNRFSNLLPYHLLSHFSNRFPNLGARQSRLYALWSGFMCTKGILNDPWCTPDLNSRTPEAHLCAPRFAITKICITKHINTSTFRAMDFWQKFHADISGDKRATVKRKDDPWAEPPEVLDLYSPS